MEYLTQFLELVMHVDRHLDGLIQDYPHAIYGLMFLVIFCETGLVVTPILPGDSLLFALGTFAARPEGLNLSLLLVLLIIAAIGGDSVNYWIGSLLGPRIFQGEKIRYLNRKHLERTHDFYERYGGKTIILARFVPIVRTFAPFVAGMGRMTYRKFMIYNIIGGVVWVSAFLILGFKFGNLPAVQKNFTFVIVAIVMLSVAPGLVEFLREWRRTRAAAVQE
jgi:membrane-associated protein